MRAHWLLAAVVLAISVAAGSRADTFGQAWVQRFTPTSNGNGRAQPSKAAVDFEGNVVVTGWIETGIRGADLFVLKYSTNGVALWTNLYNGADNGDDRGLDVAVDTLGNVFVMGYSWSQATGKDYVTLAFSRTGTPLWTNLYDGPYHLDDVPQGLAVDNRGNVFVTGYFTGAYGYVNGIATVAYTLGGAALWTNGFYTGASGATYPEGIAVNAQGNVYLGGAVGTGGPCESAAYSTRALSGEGQQLWSAQFGGVCAFAAPAGVAADANGNAYVTGLIENANFTGQDVATIAYSSAGDVLWVRRYPAGTSPKVLGIGVDSAANVYINGSFGGGMVGIPISSLAYASDGTLLWSTVDYSCIPQAMAQDGTGNIYVTGLYRTMMSFGYDFATLAYSNTGARLWANYYNGPQNADDYARSVAADANGHVYVVGCTSNNVGSKCVTIAYTGNGLPLWTNIYNAPRQLNASASAVAVGTNGSVFVTGACIGPGGTNDFATIAFSSAGLPLWTNFYNGPGNRDDSAQAIAVSLDGTVYVTGPSWGGANYDYATIAYSVLGDPLWTNRYGGPDNGDDYATAVAVDGGGNVYVTGYSLVGGNWRYATLAYSRSGTPLWTNWAGAGNKAMALVVDSTGNVVVTGDGYLTVAYSPDGTLQWTNNLQLYGGATSIGSDQNGNTFVTGYFWANDYNYGTFAYSSTGAILWTNQYDGSGWDYARGLAVDPAGNVYVTGDSMNAPNNPKYGPTFDYATVAYSNSGAPLWTNRYNAPANSDDSSRAVAVDLRGNVVVTGVTPSAGGGHDLTTIVYSQSGVPLFTNLYNGPANGDDLVSGAGCLAVSPDGGVFVAGASDGDYSPATTYNYLLIKYAYGDPLVVSQPLDQTNNAGTLATFSVTAGGTPPFSYQWLKGGLLLADGAGVFGTQTATLTLSNVLGGDAGGYSVIVSNASGSVTSRVAALSVVDPLLIGQDLSQWVNTGQTVALTAQVLGTPVLAYQWQKDGTNLPGATSATLSFAQVQLADAGDYRVIVNNQFGSASSVVATLRVNLAANDRFGPGANGPVYTLAIQADGRILAAGEFDDAQSQARARLARLFADGSLDSSFRPEGDGLIDALAVLGDGSILVGGTFTNLGGQSCSSLGRLNPDGTPDTSFNACVNGDVYSLVVDGSGMVLVGGDFSMVGGQPHSYLARLNPNGLLDASFNPAADGAVRAQAVQSDGAILVGGDFMALAGQARQRLARLLGDGTLDAAFDPGANGEVNVIAVQADGKILVGGNFTVLGGVTRCYVGRLNPNGSVDTSFNPAANGAVTALAVLTDGRIVLGGSFTRVGSGDAARSHIVRLSPDGTVDGTFNPGADNIVGCVAVQADGKLLVGGAFSGLGGLGSAYLGRLLNTDAASQDVIFDGSSINWLRAGAGPEISSAAFEVSSNGLDWSSLGNGTRVTGGWQLAGLSLATNSSVRARGAVVSAGDSSWYVQTQIGPLAISTQPLSRTNYAGTTATFSVLVGGDSPADYQWYKDGTALLDSGTVSGSHTSILTLSNVSRLDEGGYSVIVSNASASVTSVTATLRVVDPFILVDPVGQWANAGDEVVLTVVAGGAPPLSYQWRKDGTNRTGATGTSLRLDAVGWADRASYDVVVSDRFGTVTSTAAFLVVNLATADSLAGGVDAPVKTLAVQPDGRVLAGGQFSVLGGQPHGHLGRLNADGSLDASFNPIIDGDVYAVAVQPGGAILLGGAFRTVAGQFRLHLAQLNPDGTPNPFPLANSNVFCLAFQADGKVLIGGAFTSLGGPRNGLARLNAENTLDNSFSPGAKVGSGPGAVRVLAVQSDGQILVAGDFTSLGGQMVTNFGRLAPNGVTDLSFRPSVDGSVRALAVQPDGRIVVGGSFSALNGQPCVSLGRLNSDGTLDASFDAGLEGGSPGSVNSLVLQADGKFLVGGDFTASHGQPRNSIARLYPDGTPDPAFNPGSDGPIFSLALQPDGKVIVAGGMNWLAAQPRSGLGRLNNPDPATQSLAVSATQITWLRSGATPELSCASFELSTNITDWSSIGPGVRVAGGWQSPAMVRAPNSLIRARGLVAGSSDGSSWVVENIARVGPQIEAEGFFSNFFRLSICALPGDVLVIEASSNLVTWIPLQTNLVTDLSPIVFIDAESSNIPVRFYRARVK
jgi:uncharacterized delta-60 repeat protein